MVGKKSGRALLKEEGKSTLSPLTPIRKLANHFSQRRTQVWASTWTLTQALIMIPASVLDTLICVLSTVINNAFAMFVQVWELDSILTGTMPHITVRMLTAGQAFNEQTTTWSLPAGRRSI